MADHRGDQPVTELALRLALSELRRGLADDLQKVRDAVIGEDSVRQIVRDELAAADKLQEGARERLIRGALFCLAISSFVFTVFHGHL